MLASYAVFWHRTLLPRHGEVQQAAPFFLPWNKVDLILGNQVNPFLALELQNLDNLITLGHSKKRTLNFKSAVD